MVVHADAHGGYQPPLFGDADHFYHGNIHFAEEAEAHLLLNVRQVDVGIGGFPCIDGVVQHGVGDEGAAEFQAACLGQHAVAFRRGGCARYQADLEGFACFVCGSGTFGNGSRQGFGIACAGETAHANQHVVLYHFCGLLRTHDFAAKACVADAF